MVLLMQKSGRLLPYRIAGQKNNEQKSALALALAICDAAGRLLHR